jgi:1-acyl-sn-glycerol-3-phosphate acyltransferase
MIPQLLQPPFADYESPALKPGLFTRNCPTAAFYARTARIVLKSAWKAKRGNFSDDDWYAASLVMRGVFEKTGARLKVEGTEHIASLGDEPCLFIGNHMSTAETFLLGSVILPFRRVTFVVKQGLVEYPIFKHIMISRDPIVVGRSNPREDLKAVMEGGKERFAKQMSVVIFPQKTRASWFDRQEFNTIGVKLAKRSGVPVVPLALRTDAWSNGRKLKDFGPFYPQRPVHFAFGKPLRVEKGDDRSVHEAVADFIEGKLREWGAEVRS